MVRHLRLGYAFMELLFVALVTTGLWSYLWICLIFSLALLEAFLHFNLVC